MTVADLTDFGVDIGGWQSLAPVWPLASGRLNLCYAIARRLTTPLGTLDDHPEYGYDVRALLNWGFSPAELAAAQASIQAQCLEDERVQDATVSIALPTDGRMTITIALEDATGPFDLVLGIDSVSAAVLSVDGVPISPAVDIGGSTTTASSVIIVQGQPGPQGPAGSGGGGGGGGTMLAIGEAGPFGDTTGAEAIVVERVFDFGILGSPLTVAFSGSFATASGTATFRMRIGGTYGAADGTVVASLTTTATSPTKLGTSGTYANPTGLQFVKITVQGPSAGVDATVADIVATAR